MARWRIESTLWLKPEYAGKSAHAAWLVHARHPHGGRKSIEAFQLVDPSKLSSELREESGRPVSWLTPYLDDERLPDRILLTASGVVVEVEGDEGDEDAAQAALSGAASPPSCARAQCVG